MEGVRLEGDARDWPKPVHALLTERADFPSLPVTGCMDGVEAAVPTAVACAGSGGRLSWAGLPAPSQPHAHLVTFSLLPLLRQGAWAEWKKLCQMLSPLLEVEAELGPADSAIETDEPRATTPGADEQRPGPAEGWTEANANTTTKALARCGSGHRASPPSPRSAHA